MIQSTSRHQPCTLRARQFFLLALTFPLVCTKTEAMPGDPLVPNNLKNKVTKLEVLLIAVVNALREVREINMVHSFKIHKLEEQVSAQRIENIAVSASIKENEVEWMQKVLRVVEASPTLRTTVKEFLQEHMSSQLVFPVDVPEVGERARRG